MNNNIQNMCNQIQGMGGMNNQMPNMQNMNNQMQSMGMNTVKFIKFYPLR